MPGGTTTRHLARHVHSSSGMKPSDFTSAERWLVIAGSVPLIFFGMLVLLA